MLLFRSLVIQGQRIYSVIGQGCWVGSLPGQAIRSVHGSQVSVFMLPRVVGLEAILSIEAEL